MAGQVKPRFGQLAYSVHAFPQLDVGKEKSINNSAMQYSGLRYKNMDGGERSRVRLAEFKSMSLHLLVL
jgi:hypothetical protein